MLEQKEALRLIALPKRAIDSGPFLFPDSGNALHIYLVALNNAREQFILDVNRRGRIRSLKCTYQDRYQMSIILVRLDINGPPHDNPDGTLVSGNHIHIYREGYDDRFAYEFNSAEALNLLSDPDRFGPSIAPLTLNTSDLLSVFHDFCHLINVVSSPQVSFQTSMI